MRMATSLAPGELGSDVIHHPGINRVCSWYLTCVESSFSFVSVFSMSSNSQVVKTFILPSPGIIELLFLGSLTVNWFLNHMFCSSVTSP